MAKPFVLTAQIQLQAPNVRQVVRQMQGQLQNVNANVAVNLPKNAQSQLKNVSKI